MAVETKPPFPFFRDGSGNPLEAGFLYLGTANTDPTVVANQVDVYEDAALTVAVAQPVRTLAGVPVNGAGQPVNLFVAGNYSITVKDKTNSLVYALASAAAAGGDITIASGEMLEVQSGGTVDMKDGSTLNLGDDSGGGVQVVVAATTRITGSLTPSTAATLGTPSNAWATAYIDDVLAQSTVISPALSVNDAGAYRDNTLANSPTEALLFNQQKNVCSGARVSSSGVVSTNHFNVLSATFTGTGLCTVTLDEPIEDDALVDSWPTGTSTGLEVRNAVGAGGTTIDFVMYSGGVLTSLNFAFFVISRPRGGVTSPV